MAPHREEVLRRMRAKLDYMTTNSPALTLVHENEKGIYGDTGRRCLDLMAAINSPKLRSAFDFANFVQVGERPPENWKLLKPFTAHIHIKDALLSDGHIVPAGKGDGGIAQVLPDAYQSGYRGFLSLEPHLAADKQFGGFTGPDLFKVAADALKDLCRTNGIPLAGA
jgi:sugar phosphate isomerase/epimerase